MPGRMGVVSEIHTVTGSLITGTGVLTASFLTMLLTGCASNQIAAPAAIAHLDKPAIVVIQSPQWVFKWDHAVRSTESGLSACLSRELQRILPAFEYLPVETFKKTAFPNLPAENAPASAEYVKLALTKPEVRQRLESLRLKYMIFIAGTLEVKDHWGDIFCGYGYGGGGCLGATGAQKESTLSAVVIDVTSNASTIKRDVHAQGSKWLAVIGVIPVWYDAPTKYEACKTLAADLIKDIK